MQFESDVFADQPGQQIVHPSGNFVEAQSPNRCGLRPSENQQLLDQAGGLHNGGADLFGVTAAAVPCIQACEQKIAVEHDASEDVVEVMHNATGQAANRLPSLSLELGFLNGTVGVFSGCQVRPR